MSPNFRRTFANLRMLVAGEIPQPKKRSHRSSVEVAELVEIYQWLTPEEAGTAASDLATALGEEMALKT